MTPTPEMLASVPFQYAKSVLNGEVVCGLQVKRAALRFFKWIDEAESKGYRLDHAAGMRAIAFFPKFLQHTKGPLAKLKKAFLLSPYQQFTIYNVFGWKVSGTGLRRISKVYEKEARKQGKSAKLGGVGILCQGFDGEQGAEIYVAATKEAQAKVLWEQATQFVFKSLPLRYLGFENTQREIRFKYSKDKSSVTSYFRYLGGDSKTLDGLNPSVGIIDEYHAHRDDSILEVIESAMGAREQPLVWIITTAGFNIMSPCKHYEDMCKEILDPDNEKENDRLWIMIHDLDEDDDWEDETVWEKANPNLNYNPPLLEYLRGEYQSAKNHPSKIPGFQTKHLNLWVDAPEIWIPTEVWKRNAIPVPEDKLMDPELFSSVGSFGGLDLSTTTDITAFGILSEPHPDGTRYLMPFLFCPEDTIDRRSSEDSVPYRAWRDAGWLIATPGNMIDYEFIVDHVRKFHKPFNVKRVEIDRYNASGVAGQLQTAGVEVSFFAQVISHYNEPTKEFERLLYQGKIKHNGNPCMTWMMNGCIVKQDANENVRLDKGKSHAHGKRIDGVIASIMALGGSMTGEDNSDVSVYSNPNTPFEC